MPRLSRVLRPASGLAALAAFALVAPACGGGSTHDGNPTSTMALINFQQAGVNNLALNQVLEFRFSEAVDAQSLNPASLQVREGPAFGATVQGTFRISGARVFFEPKLPGLCDLSDAGFKANTQYRVTLVGFPEQFALRRDDGNPGTAVGDPLKGTLNFEFRTRPSDDPLLFTDQIAATSPVVVSTTPADGTAAVKVQQGANSVSIDFSENLRPCTVSPTTVLIDEYQRGDPMVFNPDPLSGRNTGFTPVADADPGDKFSWGLLSGGETAVSPAQRIRCNIALIQDFQSTRITLTPEFGQFPDNALIVVQLTFGIQDFGGQALVPFVFAFTTENLPVQNGQYRVRFEGETPILKDQSTADVNTTRSPLVAQGWLLFSGDADNGANLLQPTLPENNPAACNNPRQVNDGVKDDFDPTTDVVLDTGLTVNGCPNKTDGSTAVVWEFRTFRIRAPRTVRIAGVNPAIILVQGDVTIDTGATLRVRGDGVAGTPQSAGANGGAANAAAAAGGVGVAGAGNGGRAEPCFTNTTLSEPGRSGFASPSGQGALAGVGAGLPGAHASISSFNANYGTAVGGGGGGHSEAGMDGSNQRNANNAYTSSAVPSGGASYSGPAMNNKMPTPEAGSGAGGGGSPTTTSFSGGSSQMGGGGAGGAGGGFLDLTSSGNINIFGILDAAGGKGGNATQGFYISGGGGGGGSGGGLRMLTPFNINVSGGTITTAGGALGSGATTGALAAGNAGGGPPNPGGAGGKGRVVFEDGDSLLTGIGSATIVPAEGDPSNGFYRGIFDPSRFQGGGLEPQVVSDVFAVGPTDPSFVVPVSADLVASIPTGSDRGLNATSILIEARAYQRLPDGEVDLVGGPTAYRTVGYFRHSGVASAPTWVPNANPGDVAIPSGNGGPGITALNGREFIQLRITFFLPSTIGPFDPGPILDDWTIRFTFDQ